MDILSACSYLRRNIWARVIRHVCQDRSKWCLKSKLVRLGLILMAALLMGTNSVLAQEAGTREYRIKAAFLYNFARFVEWPDQTADTGNGFGLCVLGEDPFGTALDTIKGKLVNGQPIKIKAIADAESVNGCHVLFVGADNVNQLSQLLEPLRNRAILTVGEGAEFINREGMIGLRIESNKVRFDVNRRAATEGGLRISSDLLRLATRVIQ